MAGSAQEAISRPSQTKQPSRKGKKAWRKNVDISQVEEGQRILAEQDDESDHELYVLDKVGTGAKPTKAARPLREDLVLGATSNRRAVPNRKRRRGDARDSTVHRLIKRIKSSQATTNALAIRNHPADSQESQPQLYRTLIKAADYDPWAIPSNTTTMKLSTGADRVIEKPENRMPQPEARIQSSHGERLPTVLPADVDSYNPTFDSWSEAVDSKGREAVEAERKWRVEIHEHEEMLARAADAVEELLVELASDGTDDATDNDRLSMNPAVKRVKKTKAQRNKLEKTKKAAQLATHLKKMKARTLEEKKIAIIAALVQKDAADRKAQEKRETGNILDPRTMLLASSKSHLRQRIKHQLDSTEITLPDDLQDSLRLLKPEGNLLRDFVSKAVMKGEIESRKMINQPKKPMLKETEKWSYKDWKL